ncbi:hypothetical protein RFI_31141 [Reticulomyxa filosa]|uniref:Uncharacterized protein n=1 Tax=Reticulomyxa filosa TaxID=46433 RepID=X6LY18_RETFI|nr:hypothetical protein RFI_31141 [Reticulomyxa filosa]|eukprot:ETO06256.1 hypothetical protein RFI_31141 [Reticulomyxa filosa]
MNDIYENSDIIINLQQITNQRKNKQSKYYVKEIVPRAHNDKMYTSRVSMYTNTKKKIAHFLQYCYFKSFLYISNEKNSTKKSKFLKFALMTN